MTQKGFAGFPLVILIVVLIFAGLVYVFVISERYLQPNNSFNSSQQLSGKTQVKEIIGEKILEPKFSKSLEELDIYNLPSTGSVRGWAKVDNRYFVSGAGGLVEFDAVSGKVVRFNDPDKWYCDSNLIVVKKYLYTSCRAESQLRYTFGELKEAPGEVFIKIDVDSGEIVQNYLINGYSDAKYNHHLYLDGETIWLATFDGLGKLDLNTNKFNFYHKELGIYGTKNSVSSVLIDKNKIWFYISASAYSEGGVVLFDKNLEKFTGFGPKILKKNTERFDLTTWKLVPGGIEVATLDYGPNEPTSVAIKRFYYESGKWEEIKRVRYDQWEDLFETDFKPFNRIVESSRLDRENFSQLYNDEKDSLEINNFNGRELIGISPVIGGKRFILTSAGIDVVDKSLSYPSIYIKSSQPLSKYLLYPSEYNPLFFDVEKEKAIYVITECGQVCTQTSVWYFDLKDGSVAGHKTFNFGTVTQSDPFITEISKKLLVQSEGEQYVIKNENDKKLISINKQSGEVVFNH